MFDCSARHRCHLLWAEVSLFPEGFQQQVHVRKSLTDLCATPLLLGALGNVHDVDGHGTRVKVRTSSAPQASQPSSRTSSILGRLMWRAYALILTHAHIQSIVSAVLRCLKQAASVAIRCSRNTPPMCGPLRAGHPCTPIRLLCALRAAALHGACRRGLLGLLAMCFRGISNRAYEVRGWHKLNADGSFDSDHTSSSPQLLALCTPYNSCCPSPLWQAVWLLPFLPDRRGMKRFDETSSDAVTEPCVQGDGVQWTN